MTEFKTWTSKNGFGDGWVVFRSALPNDERPFRILGKFNTEEEAKAYIMQLWYAK